VKTCGITSGIISCSASILEHVRVAQILLGVLRRVRLPRFDGLKAVS
jgi:hypothetical protein